MDNPEEVLHSLEEFSKIKPKDIPNELDDYLCYVAKTGDPVFKWSIIKCLFREKLLKVITDFYESTLTIDLPPCPNVDPFNYERMKSNLLERLEAFHGAPFTVQRISELLTNPRKEYNRADKFMRAIEKNILVVSTREPGRYPESDTENSQDTSFNGMPEPNDTAMDSSFSCNDLSTDPDSSSPSYDIVNSESNDNTYTVKLDTDSLNQFSESVKSNIEDPLETSSSEETSSTESESVRGPTIIEEPIKDINNSDKECESVICSTVPLQSDSDCSENENSSEVINTCNTAEISELTIKKSDDPINLDCTENVQVHSIESEQIESTENETQDTSEESLKSEKNVTKYEEDDDEAKVDSQGSERTQDEVELCLESGNAQTETNVCAEQCDETKDDDTVTASLDVGETGSEKAVTAECDTSNSCDSDIDLKPDSVEPAAPQPEVTLGESDDNEVTSCVFVPEDKEEEINELCIREASVIHVTAEAESEPMEVDECQISSAQQSEC
jgi:serine/threonine-protein phosphatase 4 regulatory subunit 2